MRQRQCHCERAYASVAVETLLFLMKRVLFWICVFLGGETTPRKGRLDDSRGWASRAKTNFVRVLLTLLHAFPSVSCPVLTQRATDERFFPTYEEAAAPAAAAPLFCGDLL